MGMADSVDGADYERAHGSCLREIEALRKQVARLKAQVKRLKAAPKEPK